MKETARINNIVFTLGNKYLHKIVNRYEQNEHSKKILLSVSDYETAKEIFSDDNLSEPEKWQKVAKIASYYESVM